MAQAITAAPRRHRPGPWSGIFPEYLVCVLSTSPLMSGQAQSPAPRQRMRQTPQALKSQAAA